MKIHKTCMLGALVITLGLAPLVGRATEDTAKAKAKPYPLKTCVVSDEKLGEMGKPYVFVYEGQEMKLCCKGCLKDFNKEPKKYLKKMAEAEAKAKKKSAS